MQVHNQITKNKKGQNQLHASISTMPIRHAMRSQDWLDDHGWGIEDVDTKPVFDQNYQWLFRYNDDKLPLDAEPHRKLEQQWAIRVGKGKFPCSGTCQICHNKPDGLGCDDAE